MDPSKTAIILIGYQNDYFSEQGILRSAVEESTKVTGVLKNTVDLLRQMSTFQTFKCLITTPIVFTPNYGELDDPVGILKVIVDTGAFQEGSIGIKTITELDEFKSDIIEIPGKIGLNAFRNTKLHQTLKDNNIEHVVLAGAVASICIDSTGRAASELGYSVTVLSDCVSSRSVFEQNFYCESIFPLYAGVLDHQQFINQLTAQ